MKSPQKIILAVLLTLLLIVLGAIVFTHSWANYRERMRAIRMANRRTTDYVDTRALDTAQQLAPLAVSRSERDFAQEALRLADYAVDLAFAAALEDAAENPAPLTPETRALAARIKTAEATLAADQNRATQLTQQVAKALGSTKDDLQDQLDLLQAQIALDQDEVDDSHLDMIRAGGDRQATIQQMLDQHKASEQHPSEPASTAANTPAPSIESTKSSNLVAQAQAWFSLDSKAQLLQAAHDNAQARVVKLTTAHQALEKELDEEKVQKKVVHKKTAGAVPAAVAESAEPAEPLNAKNTALAFIKHLAGDQKALAQLDKRIETEHDLAEVYANWILLVGVKKQSFLHGIFVAVFWILLIALMVFLANEGVQRYFAGLIPERRQLHTLRAIILLSVQVLGVLLLLLVIFGPPNNVATVVALAGAGLTVALKDFIVGFFGWFVLMGKDGIRPGDWVEINGVPGEVVEVGLLHTVLLETGNWTDAAHPTGRKVTFVNSYAIEGHYFNFSTAGQWLWDELEVQVPPDADPYPVAEAIQKLAADETAANAKLAEQEWQRSTPNYAARSFSAAPSLSVRPDGGNVNILVRYITRANERQDVRSRLYRAVVDLLHRKRIPGSASSSPVTSSEPERT